MTVRQDYIQGVRALAVVAVIAHHFADLKGGFVGVDIFFVVSGYVIGRILLRELAERGTVDLVRFAARRARRLLPNALLTLAAILLAGLHLMPASSWQQLAWDVSAAAVYLANFSIAAQNIGYFHPNMAFNPVMHFWSLSVEEQFYIVGAVLFAAAALARRYAVHAAVALVAAATVVSFAASVMADPAASQSNFFLTQYRVWQIGAGILAAAAEPRARTLIGRAAMPLAFAALLVLLYLPFHPLHTYPWPGVAALAPVLATAAFLVTARDAAPVSCVLSWQPVQWIGDRSYSLYLWHWPVVVFSRFLFDDSGAVVAGALAVTVIFAEAAYRFVELPIHKGGRFRRPSMCTAAAAATACAVMFTAPFGAVRVAYAVAPDRVERGEMLAQLRKERSRVEKARCFSSIGRWADYDKCIFGDRDSERRIVLLGDSHAMHWFDGLEPAAAELGYRLQVAIMQACPPLRLRRYYHVVKGEYVECGAFMTRALDRSLAEPPAVVVLAMAPSFGLVLDDNGGRVDRQRGRELFRDAIVMTAREFSAVGSKVVLAIDPPRVRKRYEPCVGRGENVCSFPFPEEEKLNPDRLVADLLKDEIAVADFTDTICPDGLCITFRDGSFTYRDQTHLTPQFSASLKDRWIKVIRDSQSSITTTSE